MVGLSSSKKSLEWSGERRWGMFTRLTMACCLKKRSGGGIFVAARRKLVGVSLVHCVSREAESLRIVLILSMAVLCNVIQVGAA